QLIKKVEIIPLEVIVRNIAAGSMSKRLGVEEGTVLSRAVVEFCYKKDELGDPLVTEEHINAFNWATPQEVDDMIGMSLRVNDFLSGMFAGVGIKLVDFKLEFGRYYENDMLRTILADEISPDSCRLWDMETGKKLDKDRFREDLGGLTDAYTEVARRLGIIKESDPAASADILEFNGAPK
ncbi:MAG: phosphoribosylaminoimidazolesuccinocarboxamide synthase, partial [Hyphomonadaceae bacterium]